MGKALRKQRRQVIAQGRGQTIKQRPTVKENGGPVLMPPAAYGRLSDEGRAAVVELQEAASAIAEWTKALDYAVESARKAGASWHAIGWSIGTTGEAARQRWGSRIPT